MPSPKFVAPVSLPLPEPPRHEIVLSKDEPNPNQVRTIAEIVSVPVREQMEKHMWEYPELFHQNEKTLMEIIRGKKGEKPHGIGETENRLRISFWMEFDRAAETGNPMQMVRVYSGICTGNFFHQNFISKPEKLAWMLCPPVSYAIAMEEALIHSIGRLREVLDFPLYNKKGEPDVKVGELILKAYEKLDLRVKGAVIQRIETKNLHAHAHLGKPEAQEDMGDLDKRLAELEERAMASGLAVEVKADGE